MSDSLFTPCFYRGLRESSLVRSVGRVRSRSKRLSVCVSDGTGLGVRSEPVASYQQIASSFRRMHAKSAPISDLPLAKSSTVCFSTSDWEVQLERQPSVRCLPITFRSTRTKVIKARFSVHLRPPLPHMSLALTPRSETVLANVCSKRLTTLTLAPDSRHSRESAETSIVATDPPHCFKLDKLHHQTLIRVFPNPYLPVPAGVGRQLQTLHAFVIQILLNFKPQIAALQKFVQELDPYHSFAFWLHRTAIYFEPGKPLSPVYISFAHFAVTEPKR